MYTDSQRGESATCPNFTNGLAGLRGRRPAQAQTVTFNEQIAPIIYNNCSKCHHTGEVAPFPLMSYNDVAGHGRDIAIQTQSHYMPPWKPEPGWTAYRDERRLTPEQIALIQQWVAAGMPQGDSGQSAADSAIHRRLATRNARSDSGNAGRLSGSRRWPRHLSQFRNPDQTDRGQMDPRRGIEAYRARRGAPLALLLATPAAAPASRSRRPTTACPDSRASARSSASCDTTSALNGGLGGWVPGTTPAFLPDGIAMPLPKGSDFLLQTHFHPNGMAQTEKTVIGLYYGAKPARDMTQIQVPAFFGIRSHLDIPAGETSYKVRGSFTLPADVDAVGVSAHAHLLGTGCQDDRHAAERRGPHSAVDSQLGVQRGRISISSRTWCRCLRARGSMAN